MATWIKLGAHGDLQPEMREGLRLIQKLFAGAKEDLFITSKREGAHSEGSLHPSGRAIDIRPCSKVSAKRIREKLGAYYDVVDEGNHIHIEYDPKN